MRKSLIVVPTLVGIALMAMLAARTALAEPIIINSYHNLKHARIACSLVANPEGIAECRFVGDGRGLGRKLENEVILKLGDPDSCCPRHHRDSHRKNVRRSNGIWESCSDTEHARMSQCLRRLVLGLEWRLIPSARAWMYSGRTMMTTMVRLTLTNLQTRGSKS